MWQLAWNGTREFTMGQESWGAAASAALECRSFAEDVEEELVAEDERSCYNCRYRRWNAASFTCLAAP